MTIDLNVFARSSAHSIAPSERLPSVDVLHNAFYANDALTIPAMIARQVALTPSAPAVVCGERTLTYLELEIAADNLAQRLQRRELAPNTRIAVMLNRSLDMVISLLAILKSGSSYIPLDPCYPSARLKHILDDAQPAAIITTDALLSSIAIGDITPILIDEDTSSPLDVGWPINIDDSNACAEAYVIYTSGSTGVPKGVRIPHRAMRNFLCSMRREPGLVPSDVLLSVTTISFDIAVLELFLPLVAGAKVVIAREQDVADGAALIKLMQQHNVSVLQATPITWRLLLDAGWRNQKMKMLCGGEALSRKLADELLRRGGELWNMYGPTETTVWSSALRVLPGSDPVLLGPPIDNTYFRILDDKLNEVAFGETGELFIGGEGVALGYVNRPELTTTRFLSDPLLKPTSGGEGIAFELATLYRTGDLVRQRLHQSKICLEFLGRRDHQIKIRGYRIELGEIESTLMRHPNVKQAVAIAGGTDEDRAIWAYVIPESTSNSAELQTSLFASCKEALPGYMHPAAIVVLSEFPTTPNGKIDRSALPAPERTLAALQINDVPTSDPTTALASATETQRHLALIWQSILHTDVEAHSNFFSLGGSSLMAAQLLVAIEQAFGLRLSIGALFETPTLAEQADLIRRWDGREFDFRQMVQLNRNGRQPPLIAIHNTGVYCYRLAMLLGPDQPLTGLQLFEPSSRMEYPQSVEGIASEYISLLRTVQPYGPYRLMGWCVGGVIAYEMARQLLDDNLDVSFLGLIDSWAPGHLARLSPTRAWLAEHSYRVQLIRNDLRKTVARQKSVSEFIKDRAIVKRWRKEHDELPASSAQLFAERQLSNEHYNRWLAQYLDEVSSRYSPKPYHGKITLLRSSLEPSGWFVDPQMGWRDFARGTMETTMLEGDHFTVFRGKGLQQMAQLLSRELVN